MPGAPAVSIEEIGNEFWAWRVRTQPFLKDDIPRIDRPECERDWSASSIRGMRATLADFEARWKAIDAAKWSIAQQVDYRLIGSALARVRWELDVNRRWERDPTFYLDQTLTALLEALVQPPPFDADRSREILGRMQEIPKILKDGLANLRPVRPFAQLAIDTLGEIRAQLSQVGRAAAPLLREDRSGSGEIAAAFHAATEKAIAALETYRASLEERLSKFPQESAVGRAAYQFFLNQVALLPYSPEELLAMSRQEWERAVAFEACEAQRNRGLPELQHAASIEDQIRNSVRDELAIRDFLESKGILTVPSWMGHYTIQLVPPYLSVLPSYGELDWFGGLSHLGENAVRYVDPPSPNLGYFWLATAKDPRPDMVHEGVPGHFLQMCLSWKHEDPIRRCFYDSGPIEGIGFYAEELMLQFGLFDNSPRSREIIYNFMRLRALRVEVDVRLALGTFTIAEAADYLARYVPMDRATAEHEAASFATGPGQAITYQIGKIQVLRFLADAKLTQGPSFNLRAFHDYLWKNGNVPIALLRWEHLGLDDDIRVVDQATHVSSTKSKGND